MATLHCEVEARIFAGVVRTSVAAGGGAGGTEAEVPLGAERGRAELEGAAGL